MEPLHNSRKLTSETFGGSENSQNPRVGGWGSRRKGHERGGAGRTRQTNKRAVCQILGVVSWVGATGACATRGRRTRPFPTLSFPHTELNGGGRGISLCRVRRCEGGWPVNGTSCVPSVCPGRGCSRGSSARAPNRAAEGWRGVRQTMDSDAAVAACRRLFLGFPIARRLPAPSALVRPAQLPAPRPTGPALHLEGDSGPEPSTRARLGES